MRFILFLPILLLLVPMDAAAASAKEADKMDIEITQREITGYQRVVGRYTDSYYGVLKELREGKERGGRINALRVYYPMTKQYTPFSKSIIERMTYYAYMVDTSADQAEINDALAQYRKLRDAHLANFDVITFALTLAKVDVRYGDEIFLQKIRNGLIESLTQIIGAGETPKKAYDIYSYGEEDYILGQKGGTLKNSKIYNVNGEFFNVHDIELPGGQFDQVYTNVTEPIKRIKIKQIVQENESRTAIPGQ